MKNEVYPLGRNNNMVIQESGDELLIYDLEKNKAYCLNITSLLVWQLSDGANSVSDISNLMRRKLKTAVDEDFVWLALDELRKNDLLENQEAVPNHFAGQSRREVIRKIGLASMIALPIISSVVAPSAAAAQSSNLLAFFAVCTAPGQCSSNICQFNSFGMGDGMQHCCEPGTTGGTHPGQVISASFDLCFSNCAIDASSFCCSGQAQSAGSGSGCGQNQQFRCSCV